MQGGLCLGFELPQEGDSVWVGGDSCGGHLLHLVPSFPLPRQRGIITCPSWRHEVRRRQVTSRSHSQARGGAGISTSHWCQKSRPRGRARRGTWRGWAVGGIVNQKGASSEPCTQGTSTPLKTAEESACGNSDGTGMTIPAQEEWGNSMAR